jgi:HAD superfamily hydrolase (TIGR01450 family)
MVALGKIKNFLIDMDGTIYLGQKLLPGAKDFWSYVNSDGRKGVFLTNNSARAPKDYVQKLAGMHIPAAEEQIVTSGDAAIWHLKKHFPGQGVYLLGTPLLHAYLEQAGIPIVNGTEQKPGAVLLGFDMTLTYEKIRTAYGWIMQGVPFLATHPDILCPAENGSIPDAGAMICMFEAATGVSPVILGKPCEPMAKAILEKFGFRPEETAMIGDRLYTDIAFANRNNMTGILVLSGETTEEEYKAQNKVKADYVFPSVRGLTQAALSD